MRITDGSRPRPIRSEALTTGLSRKGQHDRESNRDQNRLRPIEGRNNQNEGRDGDQRRQFSGAAAAQRSLRSRGFFIIPCHHRLF
jgi:hypothetical protein